MTLPVPEPPSVWLGKPQNRECSSVFAPWIPAPFHERWTKARRTICPDEPVLPSTPMASACPIPLAFQHSPTPKDGFAS